MPTIQDVQTWQGQTLQDNDGDKIGEIVDIYLDRQSGEPEWLAVKTGRFGSNVSFVPIREATGSSDGVRVPYDKELVKDAPNAEADGELSPEEGAAPLPALLARVRRLRLRPRLRVRPRHRRS